MRSVLALHKESGFPPSAPREPERSALEEGLGRAMRFATHSEGIVTTQPSLVRCQRGKERGKRGRRRGNEVNVPDTLAIGDQSKAPLLPTAKKSAVKSVYKSRGPQFVDFPMGGKLGLWGVPSHAMLRRSKVEDGVTTVISLMGRGEKVHLVGKLCHRVGLEWIQADFWELFADEKGQSSLKNLFEEVYGLLCKQRTVLVHCAAGIHRTGIFGYILFRRAGMPAAEARTALGAVRATTLLNVGEENLVEADRRFHGYLSDSTAKVLGMGAGERVGELLHEQAIKARVFDLGFELLGALSPADRACKLNEMKPMNQLAALRALPVPARASTLEAMPMKCRIKALVTLSDEEILQTLAATKHGRGKVVLALFMSSTEVSQRAVRHIPIQTYRLLRSKCAVSQVSLLQQMPTSVSVKLLLNMADDDCVLMLAKMKKSDKTMFLSAMERVKEEKMEEAQQARDAHEKEKEEQKEGKPSVLVRADFKDENAALFRPVLEEMRQDQTIKRRGSALDLDGIVWDRPLEPRPQLRTNGMQLPQIEQSIRVEKLPAERRKVENNAKSRSAHPSPELRSCRGSAHPSPELRSCRGSAHPSPELRSRHESVLTLPKI